MRVLVTGATGFLGRNVVQSLLRQGYEVRCLVHTPGKEAVFGDAPVEVCYGDVRDPLALKASMYQVDAVVHLVALLNETLRGVLEQVNVVGTLNVTSVARERGVGHIVYVSVVGARDSRTRPFLRSRWLAEQEVLGCGLPYTIIRFPPLFGLGDELTSKLVAFALLLPVFPLPGFGFHRIQPMSVEDAAICISKVFTDKNLVEKTIELGGPELLRSRDIVNIVCRARRLWRPMVPVPLPIVYLVPHLFESVHIRLPVSTRHLEVLASRSPTSEDAVEKVFQFKPKRLAESLQHVNRMSWRRAIAILLGVGQRYSNS
jgi:NADH dehydrogenase